MDTTGKLFIGGMIALFVLIFCFSAWNESNVLLVQNCKVIDLQQQQIIRGSGKNISTEIRYLVITDKETFVCENSFFNGKFNNSDIYWRLKKDSVYTFKVAGLGKSMITDYRNILQVVKQ